MDIGEIIQHGVVFDFKNWRGGTVDVAHLPQAVAHLFELLEKRAVDFVLVGGVALLQYVEGRNTQDVDLIVDADALGKLPELAVLGKQEDFARARFEGLRVDFLFASNRLFRQVRDAHSAILPFRERKIRCATVDGLLLLKLYALPSLYRQGNFQRVAIYEGDVSVLMQIREGPLAPVLDQLKPHLSVSDFEEVKSIVAEIGERIERFERKQKRKD